MMKFAKYDSPVLLEVLGALLRSQGYHGEVDAKLLAARAYLKASYEFPEGSARVAYREMAGLAIQMRTPNRGMLEQVTLAKVEEDFHKELAEGKAWYAELREKELSWLRDSDDPEAEFDKLYEFEPEVSGMDVQDPMTLDEKIGIALNVAGIVCSLFVVASIVGTILLIRRMRRRHLARSLPAIQTPPLQ